MISATHTSTPWSLLRLRQSAHMRDLLAETTWSVAQLIQPIFVVEDLETSQPITGLADNARHGIDAALDVIAADVDAGVRHFLLFAVPRTKRARDLDVSHLAHVVGAIKQRFGAALCLWVDICLCASTDHGHCALLNGAGQIDLGPTLDALAAAAVAAARAGADGVSPSDMMDGRTSHLRQALDAAGYVRVPVMSYSTKFASQMYGPFREAADSAPQFGDRKHYQIDVRNRTDAIASSVRCAQEGADVLMVKPGMTSIDLIRPIAEVTGRPVGAYQVSGEFAGLVLLAERGLTNFDAALLESWHVFRRAGAAYVITYGARRAAKLGLRMIATPTLFDRARAVAPGGVHSPVRAFRSVGGDPVFFRSAHGAELTDVDGHRYIDFCQSFGPLILGHADPDAARAAHAAIDDGWSFGACEPYSLALAEWIVARVPWVERIRFVSSGTEAVMSAIRVARAATGRAAVLKFEGCYHGHADGMLVQAGSGLADGRVAASSAGVPDSIVAATLVAPLDDDDALDRVFAVHGHELAAVIVEPLPANYGLLTPRLEWLRGLADRCRHAGALLILDEVISGFRVGVQGMAGETGVRPDLVCYGKVIGGGFPVGAYAGRADLMDRVAPSGPVYQAGTLSANPVGMRVGLATLTKMETLSGWAMLDDLTSRFCAELTQRLAGKAPGLEIVRHASIFWIRLASDTPVRSVASLPAAQSAWYAKFFHAALRRGVYFPPAAFEVGFVSLAHDAAILARAADAIVAAAIEARRG